MNELERLALAPPRAAGTAAGTARIRVLPEDFEVHEQLGFEAAGKGEHVLLQVRKREANTQWVARELARIAGVKPFDVGYAGLKDRRAVTTQWFTVPSRRREPSTWLEVRGQGYEVLTAQAHTRKLPRGALAANVFRIVLRDFKGDAALLQARVDEIARRGVPNYFGPQRFGRDLANLRLDPQGGSRDRAARGFEFSALRSVLFNAVLAERVERGNWDRLHVGERANLDGSNSSFRVESIDTTLESRLTTLDIHPTGPLYGLGASGIEGDIAELETAVLERHAEITGRLLEDRLEASRRPLRVAARDLTLEWQVQAPGQEQAPQPAAVLSFRLRPGSFATTVLRELVELDTATATEDEHD